MIWLPICTAIKVFLIKIKDIWVPAKVPRLKLLTLLSLTGAWDLVLAKVYTKHERKSVFGLEKCLQPVLEGSTDTASCYCAPQTALHIFYAQGEDM